MNKNTTIIKMIELPDTKAEIAERILTALPDWFGIPESTRDYIEKSRKLPFWAAFPAVSCSQETENTGAALGFIVLKETSPDTAEIYVMGILPEYHRQGIGRQLFDALRDYAQAQSYSFLQVKTVQEGHYKEYDQTNAFYKGIGFRELECFPTLWDEWNPCQILVMAVSR